MAAYFLPGWIHLFRKWLFRMQINFDLILDIILIHFLLSFPTIHGIGTIETLILKNVGDVAVLFAVLLQRWFLLLALGAIYQAVPVDTGFRKQS